MAYAASGRLVDAGRDALVAAGCSRAAATDALRSVARYVIGFFLVETAGGAELPRVPALLGAAPDAPPGDLFAFGLGLLLDGLEARLTRRA